MTNKRIQLSPTIAMRLNDEDKARLRELSSRLGKSQTETVRVLVRERLAKYSLNKNTAKGTR
jgi:predicted DNA-binding protein